MISNDGTAIASDALGNITSLNGWTYNWSMGRQLDRATNGSTNISYVYNSDGLRTKKTVDGIIDTSGTVVVNYTYDAWGNIVEQRH